MKILKLPEPSNDNIRRKIFTINGIFSKGDLIVDKQGFIFQIVEIYFPNIRLKAITPNPHFANEDSFNLYSNLLGEDFRQFTDRAFPMLLVQPTDKILTYLEEMGMLTY